MSLNSVSYAMVSEKSINLLPDGLSWHLLQYSQTIFEFRFGLLHFNSAGHVQSSILIYKLKVTVTSHRPWGHLWQLPLHTSPQRILLQSQQLIQTNVYIFLIYLLRNSEKTHWQKSLIFNRNSHWSPPWQFMLRRASKTAWMTPEVMWSSFHM